MAIDVWAFEREPRHLAWLATRFPGACGATGYRSSAVAATSVLAWPTETGALAVAAVIDGERMELGQPGGTHEELLVQVLANGAAKVDGRWVPAASLYADFLATHGHSGVALRFQRCMAGEFVLAVAPNGASILINEI